MLRVRFLVAVIGVIALVPAVNAAEPSLGGVCPVCLYELGKPLKGVKEFQATYDRQTFLFPHEKALAMFKEHPQKYTPVLAGDCVVCLVEMGVRMPGKAEFAVKHQDRLYLFPSDKQLAMFKQNPSKYLNADAPLGEYCPICLVAAKKWVAGKKELASIYDGMRFHFPDADMKKKFDASPAFFVPALGGNCTVCLKDGGKHMRGSSQHALINGGRAFLFPDAGAMKKFNENAASYANVDLANKGNCIVCEKLAGKAMPGSEKHASVYKGLRYLFPSDKEREMFDSDPVRFTSVMKTSAINGGDANKNLVSIQGRSTCAACEFGVRPMTDPDSLGLAVVTADKVYIVERAERLYPNIFAGRFQGGAVQLRGTPTKTEGRFVWIEPAGLQAAR